MLKAYKANVVYMLNAKTLPQNKGQSFLEKDYKLHTIAKVHRFEMILKLQFV